MTRKLEVSMNANPMKRARTIMFQGTSSDVGKSLMAAALCRILVQDGCKVAPFKSQNMSLNSYVTVDGKEIGRAQGMQADACAIAATTDMNPILLKPSQDMSSQVVVHGKLFKELDARSYREEYLPMAETIVKDALARLRAENDVVVIEGAGSPAEINLKDRDIVNMRLALWADAPVILVADIDRGGVFASIVGTLDILEPQERERIKGIIINKFRGDVSLLQPGIDWLEERIGKPVLGVVPYLPNLQLEDEDSASLNAKFIGSRNEGDRTKCVDIAVIRLPRISNFTDIDPLLHEPDVLIRWIDTAFDFGNPDAVILPGSKNTAEDLLFLRKSGIADRLMEHVQHGGSLAGICGGYQMMGERLLDPDHVESGQRELAGLGFFPMETVFTSEKRTVRVKGTAEGGFLSAPVSINGYEIHMGQSSFTQKIHQPFRIVKDLFLHEPFYSDGALTMNGKVWGTYIHGVMHNDEFRRQWLNKLRGQKGLPIKEKAIAFQDLREKSFDRLAEHFAKHVDMEKIYSLITGGVKDE